jgi:hypothetical protein
MYKESIVEQLSSRTDGIASGNTIKMESMAWCVNLFILYLSA